MHAVIGIPGDRRSLEDALESLVRINERLIRAGRLPRLYKAGVHYHREGPRRERWLNARELLATRHGDCEDLACYLAAERRAYDGDLTARAIATPSRAVPGAWHAQVQHGSGHIEDPSRRLGMGRSKRRWRR